MNRATDPTSPEHFHEHAALPLHVSSVTFGSSSHAFTSSTELFTFALHTHADADLDSANFFNSPVPAVVGGSTSEHLALASEWHCVNSPLWQNSGMAALRASFWEEREGEGACGRERIRIREPPGLLAILTTQQHPCISNRHGAPTYIIHV